MRLNVSIYESDIDDRPSCLDGLAVLMLREVEHEKA